nr:MAG TPA: hypothetical protein [Caudoviricetes sp.]
MGGCYSIAMKGPAPIFFRPRALALIVSYTLYG